MFPRLSFSVEIVFLTQIFTGNVQSVYIYISKMISRYKLLEANAKSISNTSKRQRLDMI